MIRNYTGDLTLEQLAKAQLSRADIPEIVSDEAIANNEHVHRLRIQEPDLSTIVFQNRDGTKTAYLFSFPVKYVDENGILRDKSNALSSYIENKRYSEDYAYVNQYNDIKTYYPNSIQSEKGMVLETLDFTIELAPLYAIGKQDTPAVDVIAQLARKIQISDSITQSKDAVEYYGVFGDNTSLRYSSTFEGFKEDIILYENIGLNRFSFRLLTNGLSLVCDELGKHYLANPFTGEHLASIGELIVLDSGKNENVPNFSAKHYYEFEVVELNQEYVLTIVVDQGYLNDPETVYPVYIDPEISALTGSTKNILDAPIYEYVNTAQGSNIWNIVGKESTNWGIGRTIMRFPGLATNPLYTNSNHEITSLKLHLYNSSTNTNSATITARQYTGSGSWSETGVWYNNITWNSNGTSYSSVAISTNNKWYEFNLTNAPWKTNVTSRNQGIMLRNSDESNSNNAKTFSATERSSQKPYLTFEYRRTDLKNATTILTHTASQLTALSQTTYNCYGNGIGKQIRTNPTGYTVGQSTRAVFNAVVNDLGGAANVRELSSINSTINSDEFRVAMKCGPDDYHFIRQLSNGTWYNKSGTMIGLLVAESVVTSAVWYPMYQINGVAYYNPSIVYNDATIYFAVKKAWFS